MNDTQKNGARRAMAKTFGVTPEQFEFQDSGTGVTNVYLDGVYICALEAMKLSAEQAARIPLDFPALTTEEGNVARQAIAKLADADPEKVGLHYTERWSHGPNGFIGYWINDRLWDGPVPDNNNFMWATRPAEFNAQEVVESDYDEDTDEEWGDADDEGDHYPENHGEPWNESDYITALEAYRRGEDIEEVAADLGRTPYAVVCKLASRNVLTEAQRNAFNATGSLIPVEYRGTALYGDNRSPDTSIVYKTAKQVMDWFKNYNGVIDANGMKFILSETVGDDCKSRFIHHSQFRPEIVTSISLTGRFISNERLLIHGESGRSNLEAALSAAFGCKFSLEDTRTEERAY
jgi:hypothetical protein